MPTSNDPTEGEYGHSVCSLGVRGTTVEAVINPKGQKKKLCLNGRPPEPGKRCEVECDVVFRLVEGKGATFTSDAGKRVTLTT